MGKDSDTGKDRRLKEKGVTEDWMVRLNGHEFEQTLGDRCQVSVFSSVLSRHNKDLE